MGLFAFKNSLALTKIFSLSTYNLAPTENPCFWYIHKSRKELLVALSILQRM